MIENGFVYAIDKSIEKRRKQDIKDSLKNDKLREILIKHDVALNEKFSIKDWTKTDILKLYKSSKYPMRLITLNDNIKIKFNYNNVMEAM